MGRRDNGAKTAKKITRNLFTSPAIFTIIQKNFHQHRGGAKCLAEGSPPMETQRIKDYCREAVEISNHSSIHEGLNFLIGEKFGQRFMELKKLESKLKYLYPDEERGETHPLTLGGRDFHMSYTLTLNENYRGHLRKVHVLRKTLSAFAVEIKGWFDLDDIGEYLATYPRIHRFGAGDSDDIRFFLDEATLSADEVFQEVEDIFLVEEMKKMFLCNEELA